MRRIETECKIGRECLGETWIVGAERKSRDEEMTESEADTETVRVRK